MAGKTDGTCLCGGVRVTLAFPPEGIGVCHCETCRNWGSGPWLALQVPGSEIAGDTLKVYRSSRFAERGFCGTCGTHVFHRPVGGPELAIAAGLFDGAGQQIEREIFFDRKPPYYRFVADSRKAGTLRMMAEWGPKLLWRRLVRRAQD